MFVLASRKQESFSIVDFYQSELLNFAVWVLWQDGLQVEGFGSHSSALRKQSELKALGFDAEEWKAWVKRIALCEYAQNLSIERLYPYDESAVCHLPLVLDGIAVEGKNAYSVCDRLLSDLSSRLSSIPRHRNPIAFVESTGSVKLHLQVLWERYRQGAGNRIYFVDDLSRLITKDSSIATRMHEAMHPGLFNQQKVIACYFVYYPYEPTFYISDSTIILGTSKSLCIDEMLMLLESSTKSIS